MIVTVTLNPAVDQTLTVDRLRVGETNRIRDTEIDPGGKGLNVSRVVKRLDSPTVCIALLGGETGHFIRNRLEREEVQTGFVWIEAATRVNISILDESTDVQTNLNHEGPEVDHAHVVEVESTIREWLRGDSIVALGGSLPQGVPTDIYAQMIRWLSDEGYRTILDTSGDALTQGVEARPYLIKPNIREAESLLNRALKSDDDVVRGARDLVGMGINTVVISMGSRGAIAASKDGVWKALPPDVNVESAIGAGDSMVAGLAISILEESGLARGLALGTAAASATVMTPGTDLCRPEDVQRLLPQVKVEQVQ